LPPNDLPAGGQKQRFLQVNHFHNHQITAMGRLREENTHSLQSFLPIVNGFIDNNAAKITFKVGVPILIPGMQRAVQRLPFWLNGQYCW
jgi:hypothetical protein